MSEARIEARFEGAGNERHGTLHSTVYDALIHLSHGSLLVERVVCANVSVQVRRACEPEHGAIDSIR